MKKAMLTVSYGTLRTEEMQHSVVPAIEAVEAVFPGYARFRAFASEVYIASVRHSGGEAYSCAEMVERIIAEGYEEICIAALLVSPGVVYDIVLNASRGFPVSRPLLDDAEDFDKIAAVYDAIAEDAGRKVLLMGHGTEKEGDEYYRRFADRLPERVCLACRTGKMCFEDVLAHLDARRDRILLMPFMLTAGNHARKEMAGEGPDSWKNMLIKRGFDVQVRLDGMGSLPGIQAMFAEKAKAAAEGRR